jgi:outer membrane receptor for ferrienterochelin and colicin
VKRRLSSRLAAALAFAALLTSATGALADARTEARGHFKKGMEAITNGRYEDGVAELKRAYEILPHPNVLYNIARAYAEAGDLENSVLYYRRYLDGNPSDRDEVAQIVGNLEARLKRQQAVAQAAQAPVAPTPVPGPTPVPPTTPFPGPAITPTEPPAPSAAELGQARTEDVFEETVVTASKGAQSPLDAPNSTSIVTEQDIRLSGITKIPELLRRFAGVDIMEVTGAQTEVSLRGFNQRLSNKILVLVNGRSVYIDLLGATFWQILSIGVEDIQRIEVVRGPGSALYGADAFNGVINIITKQPGEGRSGVTAGYGDHNTTHASLWATGRDKEFAWRASAGYDYLPRWSREVPDGRQDLVLTSSDQETSARTTRLDLRGTRQLGRDVTLGLGGGLTQGQIEILGIGPLNDVDITNVQASDITAYLNSKNFEARVYWNRFRTPFGVNAQQIGQSLLPGSADQNILDGEVQYIGRFETGKGIHHDLHIGLNYRYKEVQWTYLDRTRYEDHEGLIVHDEVKLGPYVGVVGDVRVDYVPFLATLITSPRGALLVHPSKQSTIRASVATAFRTPTFLESYLDVPVQLPFAGGSLVSQGEPQSRPGYHVQAERIFSTELGYLNQESDYFVVDTAVYYNRVSDLIELASATQPVTVSNVQQGLAQPDPATGLYPLFLGGWSNQCQTYNVLGAELGVRTFPAEGLDLYANYTLSGVQQDNSACSAEQQALIVPDSRTSTHKLNAGVQLRTKPGFDGSVDFHYVSPQTWTEQVTDVQAQRVVDQAFHLDAYTLLNARVGFRFLEKDRAEVSAMAFNLLGIEHREHPFGQVIGRRVMGYFTYRF